MLHNIHHTNLFIAFHPMSNNLRLTRQGTYPKPPSPEQASKYYRRHLVDLIMDSDRANPLFRSPIGTDRERPLQVLDIGTGKGTWAMYVYT